MSNGIRQLLGDLGIFKKELTKVYTFELVMLSCVAYLDVLNIIRFIFCKRIVRYPLRATCILNFNLERTLLLEGYLHNHNHNG